jgi:glutathione transport system permease protein
MTAEATGSGGTVTTQPTDMSNAPVIVTTVEPTPLELEELEQETRRGLLWRRFRRSRMGMFGAVVFLLLCLLAIIGPRFIAQWGYTEVDRGYYLQSPSTRHWLGTTQDGRDLFALSMRGLGKSMIVGLSVALLSTALSAIVGAFAAYFSGWFERVSLWVIDLLLVLPQFIIIAVLLRNVSPGNGIWLLIVLLTLLGWMLTARVVRSLTMSLRDREYVTAAKYMGVGGPTIVFRHIIPNISSLLIVDATIGVAAAVLAETTLSFFGFGIRPPETSLGSLIGQGARQATTFPWIFYAGAIPLVLLVLSVNFMGDGLRDALDPTSSKTSGKA